MIFAIRDDDINFFTDAESLVAIYEPILDFCKPTLCITPFAGAVYKAVRDKEDEILTKKERIDFVKSIYEDKKNMVYPIDKNKELIVLLKD